ncbi:AraC family transcriptional regulator ligand-binding domain-containing protein [Bradyrhizobium sp. U87765 SZCCT0131]|uniref:helix-turn-helix transcriptional regulator n=1 Tax=unclassified Bradyrhizobium TaxID=2631580 RepID=UPI001BAD72BA|nr:MULTISPECIES: AraC family transcriptional regulator [unclassified Bradyrhizobium]MBR1222193.1 AraC family transcriptional regulator ligand-binding domain-containing protein [Bradyrhizobium sp. U87765 SZCCT0131]MBR1265678.1 AraC family transcriptional regulator ligand-binding domain-containing protein [Bradyrhizobium sp. U87765 SZCCT0134]MBR1307894.1 AraC family transcriptional regulator ligand-binding domain-containing protein [Bradyrhizobium sp. U87765 SZCCT0110]MBR1323996.1 AraC family tra
MRPRTTVSAIAVLDLYDFLRDRGVATDAELLAADLRRENLIDLSGDALPPQEQRLPEEYLIALWRIAASNATLPHIGLLAGQIYNPATRGVLANLLCHCDDVAEALQVFQHHIGLMNPSEHWSSSIDEGMLMLTISFAPDRAYPRPAIERSMGALVTWIGVLTGAPVVPIACAFTFSRQPYDWRYPAVFGSALSFDSDINCVRLPLEVLHRPIRTADSYLKTLLMERVSQVRRTVEAEGALVRRVRQHIRVSLHLGSGIEDVCRALHVSRPTLYRRLKREGTSYTELLAAERRELAYSQIRQGQPVACVSDNLGFKDVSTFHRAFRRWFNQSPRAVRNASCIVWKRATVAGRPVIVER